MDSASVDRELAGLLTSGRYPAQSRLPTERQLAATLRTTRWAVRAALERMEAEGLVWRHVGRGTFVGPRPAIEPPTLALLSQHSSPSELIEARLIVEPALAAQAAVRATPVQMREIREAARKCASARNMEAYELWDEAFHLAIAQATGSVLLRSIFDALNTIRKEAVWGALRRSVLRPERRRFYAQQHEGIVGNIEQRRPEHARNAMTRHLQSLEVIYRNIERVRRGDDAPLGI